MYPLKFKNDQRIASYLKESCYDLWNEWRSARAKSLKDVWKNLFA